jgi:hypothetical protein
MVLGGKTLSKKAPLLPAKVSFFMLYNKYKCLTYQSRMNNQYKVHPTFTGYAVSRDGDVINRRTNRKLKPQTNRDGYQKVTLMKDKKGYSRLVNRLVLETYNPIEDSHLYHAHHNNEVRDENRLANLEWVLAEEHIREHKKSVRGAKRSEEIRRKISESMKGHLVSEETRRKVGEAKKGMKWWNDGTRNIRSKECPGEGWVRGIKKGL